MSGEFSSGSESNHFQNMIDQIADQLFRDGLPAAVAKAKHLCYQTDIDPENALRAAASKMLESDDDIMHDQAMRFFIWEADNQPSYAAASVLAAQAFSSIRNKGRIQLGEQEYGVALAHFHTMLYQRGFQPDEAYIRNLCEVLYLMNRQADVISEKYASEMIHIVPIANMTYHSLSDEQRADDTQGSISELLAYVSMALDEARPNDAIAARDMMRSDYWRDIADKHHFNNGVVLALQD